VLLLDVVYEGYFRGVLTGKRGILRGGTLDVVGDEKRFIAMMGN
jgi:hypothetical protein